MKSLGKALWTMFLIKQVATDNSSWQDREMLRQSKFLEPITYNVI